MHKTQKIFIEINLNIDLWTKDRRDICGVLAVYNVVMTSSDDALEASDRKIPMYDRYMYVNRQVRNKT